MGCNKLNPFSIPDKLAWKIYMCFYRRSSTEYISGYGLGAVCSRMFICGDNLNRHVYSATQQLYCPRLGWVPGKNISLFMFVIMSLYPAVRLHASKEQSDASVYMSACTRETVELLYLYEAVSPVLLMQDFSCVLSHLCNYLCISLICVFSDKLLVKQSSASS